MNLDRIVVSKPAFALATIFIQLWEDLEGLSIAGPLAHQFDYINDPDTRVVVFDDEQLARITEFKPDTIFRALGELERIGAVTEVFRRRDGMRMVRTKSTHWLWVAAQQQVDEWAAQVAAGGTADWSDGAK